MALSDAHSAYSNTDVGLLPIFYFASLVSLFINSYQGSPMWFLSADSFLRILDHCVRIHQHESFTMRRLQLQASTGRMVYRSFHFPVQIRDIKKKIEDGRTYDFNWETNELLCMKAQESAVEQEKS